MLTNAHLVSLMIMKIVNYNRKSRQDEELEKRTGEDTLKTQRELMERVLLPLEIPYDQFDEIGSGDKISTRPVFQRVIEMLNNEEYQAVAVKEISRLGRGSYTDMGIIYDLIVNKNICIITPYKLYDPRNHADLRQIRFELFMSREEFETTRERLNGGRSTRAFEGKWMAGKPPFGYDLDKITKKLVINEEEAAVVRYIYQTYANGLPNRPNIGYRVLASHLKETGILSPGGNVDWRTDQLQITLSNVAYIGTLKYRTTATIDGKVVKRPENEHIIIEDAHPAIIDRELFDIVQIKLKDSRSRAPVKKDFTPKELTRVVSCIHCGRKLVRQYSVYKRKNRKGEVKEYVKEFLWCTKTQCMSVKYRDVERLILKGITDFVGFDFNTQKVIVENIIKATGKKQETPLEATQYVEKRERELQGRLKFIFDKYESGIYDDETFISRKKEIDHELSKLNEIKEKQVVSQEEPQELVKISDVNDLVTKCKEVITTYHNLKSPQEKNQLLLTVLDDVVVEVIEKGRGSIPAKLKLYLYFRLDIYGF